MHYYDSQVVKNVADHKCSFEGCNRKYYARGWCKQHYHMVIVIGKEPRIIGKKGPKATEGCAYPGCTRKHYAKGWCRSHYRIIVTKGQTPREIYAVHQARPHKCTIEGCEKKARGILYCAMHYKRNQVHGDPNITLKRGVKSQGGHQEYPNHSLMKRNRLIKLAQNPICEFCGKEKSKIVHHKDGKKTNHALENLYAVCTQRCHMKEHKLMKLQKILTESFVGLLDSMSQLEKSEVIKK